MELLLVTVPILPILTTVAAYLLNQKQEQIVANISVGLILLTFLTSAFLLVSVIMGTEELSVSFGEGWGMLRLDPLGSLMSFVIAGISLVVHVYSKRYMADEEGYVRFYVLLGLMTSSLLVMVSAADLITLLVAWHFIGVLLYFLLGHNTDSLSTQKYAMWTLITYRIGDLPLVLAAALLYQAYGTFVLSDLFQLMSTTGQTRELLGMPVVEIAGILIAIAAFARSAQFLLHSWLPYTMSGPTPVSALMHAGIVNAGGFLVNRFAPLYMQTHDVLHLMFIVGLITAVIGSMLMLSQNDIKKALGYSTMGQMGFMIMECGVGAFSLAVFHLIAHGLFKGTLFLGAGGVIGEARKSDGVPKKEVYSFVIEREAKTQRRSWLFMASITLAVPLIIIVAAHWLVAQDYFQKQGAVVLLFFGWVTGAQLIFATYKMETTQPWRLFSLVLASLVIVVIGYTQISHAFDLFLYPDPESRDLLYMAAGVELAWFDLFVALITLGIVLGWLLVYHAEKYTASSRIKDSLWRSFYAVVSREFYVIELINGVSQRIMAVARKLNMLLRWV